MSLADSHRAMARVRALHLLRTADADEQRAHDLVEVLACLHEETPGPLALREAEVRREIAAWVATAARLRERGARLLAAVEAAT